MAIATSTALGIALAASVIGTGVSAYGSLQQAATTKKVASYNAEVQENNAIAQRNNAKTAVQQASVEAEKKRLHKRKIAGTQVANAAKSGVTISGSVVEVMTDSAIEIEQEALIEIYKGNLQAHSFEAAAIGHTNQSSFSIAKGNASAGQSILGAVGDGFSGVSSAFSISGGPKIG